MSLHHDLPGLCRRFGLSARGVIHVGAHLGQEAPIYVAAGFHRQVWCEPTPEVFQRLRANLPQSPTIHAFNVACGSENTQAPMFVLANYDGGANSLLAPKTHLEHYPQFPVDGTIPVEVCRLDDLLAREGLNVADYNLLCMDTQGFELHVLRGAPRVVEGVEAIMAEVFDDELYANCAKVWELDEALAPAGFRRVITNIGKRGFGDALYVRQDRLTPWQLRRLRWLGPAKS